MTLPSVTARAAKRPGYGLADLLRRLTSFSLSSVKLIGRLARCNDSEWEYLIKKKDVEHSPTSTFTRMPSPRAKFPESGFYSQTNSLNSLKGSDTRDKEKEQERKRDRERERRADNRMNGTRGRFRGFENADTIDPIAAGVEAARRRRRRKNYLTRRNADAVQVDVIKNSEEDNVIRLASTWRISESIPDQETEADTRRAATPRRR
ncbi:hypothetical protein EVAR_76349_1 [Eumeta japonica]|uniref:Uncharacterized protein n=1 Tax=Eumeta variegata TaxID=151549 RepID=A0A4C1TA91_EUMVA|nr:hypothetical protein EVAR_76349_1 [Eumeta japonica]